MQAFAARHDDTRTGGRVVMLTSGQQLGTLPGEAAYVAAKAALAGIVATGLEAGTPILETWNASGSTRITIDCGGLRSVHSGLSCSAPS